MTGRKKPKDRPETGEAEPTAEDRELPALDTARMSEPSFADDWLSLEDEEAWCDL